MFINNQIKPYITENQTRNTTNKEENTQNKNESQLLRIITSTTKQIEEDSVAIKNREISVPDQPITKRLETDPEFLERVKKSAYRNIRFPYINYPSTLRKKRLETAAIIMVAEHLIETKKSFKKYETPSRVTHYKFTNHFEKKEIHTELYLQSEKVIAEYRSIFPDTNNSDSSDYAFKELVKNTQIIKSLIREKNLPQNVVTSPREI